MQVVIVGAGPTGLTLANLLAGYGLDIVLVERNATTVQEPRAVSIDDESLRTLQAVGLVGEVLRSIVPGYGSEYFSARGRHFLTVAPTETPYGYPRRNAFRQPVLEGQLRRHLQGRPNVELLFSHSLEGVHQDEHEVGLDLVDEHGARRRLRCEYLVGADGASSAVRRAVGLSLPGETFDERWLIIDLENSPTSSRQTQVHCDVRRPSIALPGPNLTRRFEFKLHEGESAEAMLRDEVVAQLLAERGVAAGSVLKRKVVYHFHARVAERWSTGRTYLAGDACHLTPPFAGQGMNSGIRDAHNLAWKLAEVCSGRIGPGLLDTYEAERRPHVTQMIELAMQVGRIMGPPSAASAMLTQTAFRLLRIWPAARDYFGQMRYKPKPYFGEGFLVAPDRRTGAPTVGRLIPQPLVSTGPTNGSVLLDELLGDGFSLIGITDSPARFSDITSTPAFQRLSARRLAICEAATGWQDPNTDVGCVSDPSQALRRFAGASDIVLLVRPDRYVMGVFRIDGAESFGAALQDLLDRTRPASRGAAPPDRGPAGIAARLGAPRRTFMPKVQS